MMYGGFASVYDRLMDDVDYEAWCAYLVSRYSASGVLPPARVLDCACGTGNVTLGLGKAGYAVTGLDLSEEMLDVAAKKMRAAGLKIPFVRQNMTAICLPRRVMAINCSCDGVNYLTEPGDVAAFFRSAYDALKEGGLLSFDISTKYKLQSLLDGKTFGEDRGDAAYLWQNVYDPESGLIEMDLTLFVSEDGGRSFRRMFERHVQKAHEVEELCTLLERCGFCEIECFDAFTLRPPRAESERVQFFAHRR